MNTFIKRSILLSTLFLIIWLLAPITLQAASGSAGTEFYFAFQPNFTYMYASNRSLSLFVTGEEDTQGTVTIPGLNFTQSFAVQAKKVTKVSIPVNAQFLSLNTKYPQHDQQTNLGVHVVAQKEVTIYGANLATISGDAFLALPVSALGTEYIALSRNGYWLPKLPQVDYPSEIAVVGAFDNTTVTITPSVDTRNRPAGIPFTVTLNKSDTYLITGVQAYDLTGTVIRSTSPVAVMSGANFSLQYKADQGSHIVEMMPPVSTWGKSFFTVPLAGHYKGDIVRVLASQDNTTVRINGVSVSTLARGKFYETILIDRAHIETSAPALVAQYAVSADYEISAKYTMLPGPFMILITPTEQFANHSIISTEIANQSADASEYINIVTPTAAITSLKVDGLPVDATLFAPIGSSEFSGAQVPVSAGTHVVDGNMPFGLNVYGYNRSGGFCSYGYPAGMSFQPINQAGDSFSPNIKLTQVGDSIQGVATDSEDINCNGVLDAGEDLNNNGIIDLRGSNIPNSNGIVDQDTGVFKVEFEAGASNLKLDVLPFVPGALTVYFSISLIDPKLPGSGILRVSDGVGNLTKSTISLTGVPILKDVRIIDTISSNNIDIDNSSFSKTPYSIAIAGDRTIVEWRLDTFSADAVQDLGMDLVVKSPVSGEQRLVSHKLELNYTDPAGKQVHTELDSQYVNVLISAFESSIAVDKLAYQANESIVLTARINNLSEYARTFDVKITVEDSQGILVKEVALLPNQTLSAGMIKDLASVTFNTGSTLAGDYRTRLSLYENNKQVGESVAIFKVQPTMTLNSKITTDKASYAANGQVAINANVQSLSPNYVFTGLTAKITLTNSQGQALLTETKGVPLLAQNQIYASNTYWNCSASPKGTYSIQLDIFDGTNLLSSAQSSFEIVGSAVSGGVTGTVTMQPSSIEYGADGSIVYSLANKGNEDIPISLVKLLVIDPDSNQIAAQFEPMKNIVVPISGVLNGQVVLPTVGLTLKNYLVVMQLEQPNSVNSLANSLFAVKDTTPPTISILSPEKDKVYNTAINLSVIATEKVSGMGNVEYQLSDGAWNTLPLTDQATGTYSIIWQPNDADNGERTVNFRAVDLAGNQSNLIPITFKVDTIPPVLTVSTLSDGSYTNIETLNVSGTVKDNFGIVSLDINNLTVPVAADGSFSQAILLHEGDNSISITAADSVNNKTTNNRTIHLDRKAPYLTIKLPADLDKTAVSPIEVKGSIDETSAVTVKLGDNFQAVVMSGNDFSATVVPEPRWNTIEVTATDLAGNTSSQKRSVFFDDQIPSLSVTEPPQDIRTNKSSLTISGTTSDPYSAVGITVATEGLIFSPPVLNGNFSQIVNFSEEKPYSIIVTATNEVGTQASVQRNIIFDKTPPNLTIDPVTSPTNTTSQIITGTREDGTSITFTCATATSGAVEYPTATTWRVTLDNMQQGENRLQAETSDLAGNRVTATAIIQYVPQAPDVTINVSSQQLWPPNKKLVPITISGNIVTHGSDVKSVTISVVDEYGKYNMQGLKFGDTVMLEAWRDGNDMDGRTYTIIVAVTDQAGNRTTRSTTVVVPHDMGK